MNRQRNDLYKIKTNRRFKSYGSLNHQARETGGLLSNLPTTDFDMFDDIKMTLDIQDPSTSRPNSLHKGIHTKNNS